MNGCGKKKIKHVLLIRVDAWHCADVAKYGENHKGSALAAWRDTDTYFERTDAGESDSFPGCWPCGGELREPWLFLRRELQPRIFDPINTLAGAAGPGGGGNMQVLTRA